LTYSAQGTFTVNWTFDDGNGNSISVPQTVVIDDVTPPVTPTLATVTDDCSVTLTAPTTTDNCAGTITGTTTAPLTYSAQGTFTVNWTFDDGNGNSTTAQQTVVIDDVTPPVTPTLASVTDDCSVTLTAPTTTDNCAGTVTGTTTDPLTYTVQGTYTVTWTFDDGNGNSTTAQQTVVINDLTPPVISGLPTTLVVPANSPGCEAVVTWTAPDITDACGTVVSTSSTHNSGDIFPIGITTVTYFAEDDNGNLAQVSFNVEVINGLIVDVATQSTTCFGLNNGGVFLDIINGAAPIDIEWTDGASFTSNDQNISGVPAGTYFYDMEDANGCSLSGLAIIGSADEIVVTAVVNEPSSCGANDGSAVVTVTGGTVAGNYYFEWNGNNGYFSMDQNPTDLPADIYLVVVIDDFGCEGLAHVNITDPGAPTITLDGANSNLSLNCGDDADGAIHVDVTLNNGATSAGYFWNDDAGSTTQDIDNLSTGNYLLTALDNNGCVAYFSAQVVAPDVINLAVIQTDVLCNGDNNGAIDLFVNGGTVATEYSYSWNSGAFTTQNISGLAAGLYSVQVTDDLGCVAQASYTITQPDAVTGNIVASDITCNGDGNGSLDLTPTGGNGGYTFLWDDASASTTEDLSNLSAGTYIVTITDGNGCEGSVTATINEPAVLSASATSTDVLFGNDGTVNLTVTGGTAPYTYAWTGPNSFTAITEDLSGLNAAGTYEVTVTDNNGCETTTTVTVNSQVSVNSIDGITLNVFPNPSNGLFTVNSSLSNGLIIVRDALGREVHQQQINNNTSFVNLENQSNGIYFMELRSGDMSKTVRVVVAK
jgi:large repetitive protein